MGTLGDKGRSDCGLTLHSWEMGNELQIAVLWPLSCLLPSSWAQKPCAEITIPDEVKCRAALHQSTHSCFELLRLWAERTAGLGGAPSPLTPAVGQVVGLGGEAVQGPFQAWLLSSV